MESDSVSNSSTGASAPQDEFLALANKPVPKPAGFFSLYFLGLVLSLSCDVSWWNYGMYYGVKEYFFTMVVIGTGFTLIILSIGELVSCMPFGGGAYGYVRLLLGPCTGFYVGVLETLANVVYAAYMTMFSTQIISVLLGTSNTFMQYGPIYWLLLYISANVVVSDDRVFFVGISVCCILALISLTVYILGTSGDMDSDKFLHPEGSSKLFGDGGINSFLGLLPIASWFFIGVENIPLFCKDVENPQKVIPWAMLASIVSAFVIGILVMVSAGSQSPGAKQLADAPYATPLSYGYSNITGLTYKESIVFILPALIAWPIVFIYTSARQAAALSGSKLITHYVSSSKSTEWKGFRLGKFVKSQLGTSILGYCILLSCWIYAEGDEEDLIIATNVIYNVAELSSFTVFLALLASFFAFRLSFSQHYFVEAGFKNPFGLVGTGMAMVIFAFAWYGTLSDFGQDMQWDSKTLWLFVSLTLCSAAYYCFVAKKMQTYSTEERDALLKVYIIRSNQAKRARILKKEDSSKKIRKIFSTASLWATTDKPAVTTMATVSLKSQGSSTRKSFSSSSKVYAFESDGAGTSFSLKGTTIQSLPVPKA